MHTYTHGCQKHPRALDGAACRAIRLSSRKAYGTTSCTIQGRTRATATTLSSSHFATVWTPRLSLTHQSSLRCPDIVRDLDLGGNLECLQPHLLHLGKDLLGELSLLGLAAYVCPVCALVCDGEKECEREGQTDRPRLRERESEKRERA